MSRTRELLRLLLPPIIFVAVRRLRPARVEDEYRYVGVSWPNRQETRGWDTATVGERARKEWPSIVEAASGTGPLEASNLAAHNTLMSFAYAFGLATHRHDKVSVLDWGSGVGRYGIVAGALFPDVSMEYHCRDLPTTNVVGRELNPRATFHDTDDAAFARTYDFVLASSSLQYSEDWRGILRNLASVADPYLFVTRQPFVDDAESFVVIQRPCLSGYYDTEYPGWVLNRHEFLDASASLGLGLVREFVTGEEPFVVGAPEQAVYRGFLFRGAS